MICPGCGKEIPDNLETCPECGASLKSDAAQEEQKDEEAILRDALSGQYEIVRKLGEGGMAIVYLAYELALNRDVAIKLLHRKLHHDMEFVERFKREARIAAKLEHPNIVRIYRIIDDKQFCYFVMNYIRGGTLSDRIKKCGPLPVNDILRWSMDVCSALSYAHKQGVIHRDLKPDNIMMDTDDHAIVMDFGIARAAQVSTITKKGAVIGSPQYMSPELASGTQIDNRSDIYSMGVVLYQMATATLPFQSKDALTLMYSHIHDVPEPPDIRNPDVPVWLRDIILICLSKYPKDRYPTVDELSQALAEYRIPETSTTVQFGTSQKKRKTGQIIDILEKIPVLRGLTSAQLRKILSISSKQLFSKDDVLCHEGEESYKIFILLKGMLCVTFEDGKELSRITPLGIVGEMGVFTGQRRSATVVASSDCIVLTIHKTDLFNLFRKDPHMGILVLMNVVEDMAHKMRVNNILVEELKQVCPPDEYSMILSRVLKTFEK